MNRRVPVQRCKNPTRSGLASILCADSDHARKFQIESESPFRKNVNWMALIRLAMRHDVMPLAVSQPPAVCPDSVPENIFGPIRARYQAQAMQARAPCRRTRSDTTAI